MFCLLVGSFPHVTAGTCILLTSPDISRVYTSMDIVGVKHDERELMAIDIVAMSAEYCNVVNRRAER